MTQRLWLAGTLPGLNELLAAKGMGFGRRNAYNRLKQKLTNDILLQIRAQRLVPVTGPCFLRFRWHEPTRRRDPDGVAGGGRKIALDALVKAGILVDDGWDEVEGWTDSFVHDKASPGVLVELTTRDQTPL